jgi:hypothetical protein
VRVGDMLNNKGSEGRERRRRKEGEREREGEGGREGGRERERERGREREGGRGRIPVPRVSCDHVDPNGTLRCSYLPLEKQVSPFTMKE